MNIHLTNCNNFSNLPIRDAVLARCAYQNYNKGKETNWKAIPGYEDYLISDVGSVKHINSYGNKPRLLVPTLRNNSYFFITLTTIDNRRKGFPVDRLVVMTFFNIPLEKIRTVTHLDGLQYNNALSNLSYVLK